MTPVDQAQWKMSLSQSHQMINNLYTVPRINSQNSVFLSHDVQDCPHRQQQFHMLLTDGEKQMASQRPVKQRDTCTDKSYSTLSLHITGWPKKNKWPHRGPRSRRIHARTDPTARCPSTSLDGIRSRHHCIIQCAVRPHFLRRQLVEQSKVSRKVLELPQFALSLRRQHPKMHKTEKQS